MNFSWMSLKLTFHGYVPLHMASKNLSTPPPPPIKENNIDITEMFPKRIKKYKGSSAQHGLCSNFIISRTLSYGFRFFLRGAIVLVKSLSGSSSSSSCNCILMSSQPHRVTSGQSNSGHKQMHTSKIFSYI